LFLGCKQFVERVKKSYLQDKPHREMLQHKQIIKALDPEAIISKATGVIGCDINRFRQSARISEVDKKTRDMLV